MRRRFRTAELSGDEVEQIASAHMDPPRSSRQPSRPEIAMAGCNSKVLVVSYAFLRTAADSARASLYITALIVLHCQSRGTKQAVDLDRVGAIFARPKIEAGSRPHESPHFHGKSKKPEFGSPRGARDGEFSGLGGSMRAPKERFDFVHQFLKRVFIEDLHAKRVLSLANGTLGVMTGAALAVSLIGQALAQRARGLFAKSAIKQVDRLLSNAGVVPWDLFASWVREVVGERREIVVAMDWTDFDADNQSTLALHLVTRHGRATPLLWLTVDKDELKNQRNDFEDLCLSRLKALLPEGVAVTILADRGLRRRQAIRVPGQPGLSIRHPLSRRHPCQRRRRRNAVGRRLGRQRRTGAHVARRRSHRRPPEGRRGHLRESCGHEGGLASGRQRRLAFCAPDHQA